MTINGHPIDVKKYFGAFALDVIASCAFGTNVNSLQDPENAIVKNTKKIVSEKARISSAINFLLPGLAKTFNVKPFDHSALNNLKVI